MTEGRNSNNGKSEWGKHIEGVAHQHKLRSFAKYPQSCDTCHEGPFSSVGQWKEHRKSQNHRENVKKFARRSGRSSASA
eukprot:IDg954t1